MDVKFMNLNNLELNKSGKIKNLNCTGNVRRRLLDLGLIPRYNNYSNLY